MEENKMGKNEIEINGKVYILKDSIKWSSVPEEFYANMFNEIHEVENNDLINHLPFPHIREIHTYLNKFKKLLIKNMAKKLRSEVKLIAYKYSVCPDYTIDMYNPNQEKYSIYHSYEQRKYFIVNESRIPRFNNVYFPRKEAVELVKKLNSGEITL